MYIHKMKNYKYTKNWCFTRNDKAHQDLDWWKAEFEKLRNIDMENNYIKYIVCALEIGEKEKIYHFQGYVEFQNGISRKTIIKRLGFNCHLEERKGSRPQARGYIMDEDYPGKTGDFVPGYKLELGIMGQQGRSNELTEIYSKIKEGWTDFQIQEEWPQAYARWWKAIHRMRFNWLGATLENWKDIDVNVIFGLTRSGKTSTIFKKEGYENCCKIKVEGSSLWFDNYNGQKVLILDDFYGQIRISLLLQLLDGYKQIVQVKGGFKWAQWDKVYITSNCSPKGWYNSYENIPDEARDALFERITSLTEKVYNKNRKPRGLPKVVRLNQDNKILPNEVSRRSLYGNSRRTKRAANGYRRTPKVGLEAKASKAAHLSGSRPPVRRQNNVSQGVVKVRPSMNVPCRGERSPSIDGDIFDYKEDGGVKLNFSNIKAYDVNKI